MQSSRRPSSRSSPRRPVQLLHLLLSTTIVILSTSLVHLVSSFQPKSSHSSIHRRRTLSGIGKSFSLLPLSSSSSVMEQSKDSSGWTRMEGDPHVETVLFVECGFGNDSHGQNVTKAVVRACRNAIEFNSIPSVSRLVPSGYDGLKLDVILAVPSKYRASLDLTPVKDVFPYGSIRFQIQDGGMVAPSGIAIERLGDTNDDMVVVCCSVTVGY